MWLIPLGARRVLRNLLPIPRRPQHRQTFDFQALLVVRLHVASANWLTTTPLLAAVLNRNDFSQRKLASEAIEPCATIADFTGQGIEDKRTAIGVHAPNFHRRFRVVWMADPASGRAGQVGIRSVDDTCVWEAELAYFSLETSAEKSDPLAAARRDRRQYPRFRCQGNVQVSRAESGQHVWAKLGDLSLGGCYLSTPVPEALGAKLRLLLQIENNRIAALGEVRSCVPALGMGIQFTEFESGSRELLKQVLERLSPPKLVGRPQTTPLETPGSIQALLNAIRDHFEGHNVLTCHEFERIVKAISEKKLASRPAAAVPAKPA